MFDYEMFPEARLCILRGQGTVDIMEIIESGRKLLSDERWQRGWDILYDLVEVPKIGGLNYDKISKGTKLDKRVVEALDVKRVAVAAKEDIVYGYLRMWEMMSESSMTKICVFRELQPSLDWLGIKDKSMVGY